MTPTGDVKIESRNDVLRATGPYCDTTITVRKRKVYTLTNASKSSYSTQISDMTKIKMHLKGSSFDSCPSAILVALIHREQRSSSLAILNPVLHVGRVLPPESPVFQVVRSGDVSRLRELLNKRQASLYDRTKLGTPLLHASLFVWFIRQFADLCKFAMAKPDMCAFLVENGADVDERAHEPRHQDMEFSL